MRDATTNSSTMQEARANDVAAGRADGDRLVGVALVLAVIALVPGVLTAVFGIFSELGAVTQAQEALCEALRDIRFGSGLRFWLGVVGASLMALLLIYPLRKAFGQRFRLGSVGGWFRLHLVAGVAAPVLILYHTNFGFGGVNANVALVTMLVVAVSGIIGQFLHRRARTRASQGNGSASELLGRTRDMLSSIDGMFTAKSALIDRIEIFQARAMALDRSIGSELGLAIGAGRQRRRVIADARWILTQVAADARWSAAKLDDAQRTACGLIDAYVGAIRRATVASVRERVWSRWRLFHLPLFLMMSVATGLHVAAVWGVDGLPPAQTMEGDGSGDGAMPEKAPASAPAPTPRRPLAPQSDSISSVPAATSSGLGAVADAAAKGTLAKADLLASTDTRTVDRTEARGAADAAGRVVKPAIAVKVVRAVPIGPQTGEIAPPAPVAVSRTPAVAAPVASEAAVAPSQPVAAQQVRVEPTPVAALPSPKPRPVAAPVIASPPSREAPPEVIAASPAANVFSELGKRFDGPPMALGASKGLPLAARIAQLKAERFDHGRTKFPLTGKHVKVACEKCHTKSLEDTPRQCVACHKKDDVHRGRRNDCAQCHTTNRWTEIIRRP